MTNTTPAALPFPELNTVIAVLPDDIKLNDDNRTYIARVTQKEHNWVPASRFNKETGRWSAINDGGRLGIFVFIKGTPSPYIRINLIKEDGKSVHAEFLKEEEFTLF